MTNPTTTARKTTARKRSVKKPTRVSFGDPRAIFAALYETGAWDSGKAGSSGRGSDRDERKPYVDFVVRKLQEIAPQAKTVVDLGCGDGRVLADIASEFPQARYTGVDIYTPHLQSLKTTLKHHCWVDADLADVAAVPRADVWLCKDVLHHWPNEFVTAFLRNVVTAKRCKWLILCFDRNQRFPGETCPLGGYRAINPEWQPFAGVKLNGIERADFLHKTVLIVKCR